MKVELLVNLKISGDSFLKKGTVFTDPLPQPIKDELKDLSRNTVRIIEDSAPIEEPETKKGLAKRNK
jgi:hypothetical protein